MMYRRAGKCNGQLSRVWVQVQALTPFALTDTPPRRSFEAGDEPDGRY